MKKLYLVETNGTKEFWTIEMLPNCDSNAVAVLHSLYNDESVDAKDTSGVEDDSSWGDGGNGCVVTLTANELDHLFDQVKILDERNF